ncbi:hypothetical protein A6V39_00200 [Candidatus Mycoplasma haematobovis]|uniref:Uncharacterized protein n=1 Tax=Candidatus Mycoplasma haematobovis TaxID=432608 RepID=A0A1A9QFJ7_9MOLU|nr:hypothetical protein [Candidatus Mycoplasma haematobovis]OAL10470.1 hypothetical protein A6V39_00200 [Candidatus Mycoplasma haematobovis]
MLSNLAPKAKAAVFVGIGSLIAGSGTLIYDIFTTKTIKEFIETKHFTILTSNSEDSDTWKAIIQDYTEQIKTQKKLKINNFEGGDENKIQELQKACESILSVKYRVAVSNGIVNQVLWCVKQQKVEDYLIKNKFNVLKTTDTENTGDDPKWDEKIKEYLRVSENNKEKQLSEVTLEKSKSGTIDTAEKKSFINACKKLNETKHFKEDFVKSYQLATSWCAEKQGES